jgi:urea transport system permease protein
VTLFAPEGLSGLIERIFTRRPERTGDMGPDMGALRREEADVQMEPAE